MCLQANTGILVCSEAACCSALVNIWPALVVFSFSLESLPNRDFEVTSVNEAENLSEKKKNEMLINLHCLLTLMQFIDGRLDLLNSGEGFSDVFEEEINMGEYAGKK